MNCSSVPEAPKSGESLFFQPQLKLLKKNSNSQSLQKSVYLVNTGVVIGNCTNDHLQVHYLNMP